MNTYVELVKKWLADPTSVTVEELRENHQTSHAVFDFNFAIRDRNFATRNRNEVWFVNYVTWTVSYCAYSAAIAEGRKRLYWILECADAIKELESIEGDSK